MEEMLKLDEEQISHITTLVADFGINILSALVILLIGLWVAKRVGRIIEKSANKVGADGTLGVFLGTLARWGFAAFVIIAALSQVGIQTASFVAVLAAAGLAIGMALQGSLANFAAGVLILVFRPYKQGDFVEAGGVTGSVKEISIFSTILATGDNKKIIVPNSQMTGGSITNYSAYETRRVDLLIGVSYDADLQQTRAVFEQVLSAHPNVLRDQDTTVAVKELGANSVDFVLRAWVKSGDYWPTYFDLTEQVKIALDKNGIGIPYPQLDLHLDPALQRALASGSAAKGAVNGAALEV